MTTLSIPEDKFLQATQTDIHEDDPQIDWREHQEDDDSDDESESSTDTESVAESIPSSPTFAEHTAPRRRLTGLQAEHMEDLALICKATGSTQSQGLVRTGISTIVESVDIPSSFGPDFRLYVRALIIFVWQTICHKILYGSEYGSTENRFLSTSLVSLFIGACQVLEPSLLCYWQKVKPLADHWQMKLRNVPWTNNAWFHNIGPEVILDPKYNENSYFYLGKLERGSILDLAFEVVEVELLDRIRNTPIRDYCKVEKTKTLMTRFALEIFRAMDPHLLKALIRGRLSLEANIEGSPVSQALKVINVPEIVEPSIYMNTICDRKGVSPTPYQWREICNLMSRYLRKDRQGNMLAAEVDQTINPSEKWPESKTSTGFRRYIEAVGLKNMNPEYFSEDRREIIRTFIRNMRSRIADEEAAGRLHVPFSSPVVEVGYSINSHVRLEEHRHHRSSNYLMNLADALFAYNYDRKFTLQQHIIYCCYMPDQPWIAEIIFTQITQGYTDKARGFSHYPAGRSNISGYRKVVEEDWDRYYVNAVERYDLENRAAAEHEATRLELERVQNEHDLRKAKIECVQSLTNLIEAMNRVREMESAILEASQNDEE